MSETTLGSSSEKIKEESVTEESPLILWELDGTSGDVHVDSIRRGQVYTTLEVVAALGVSRETIDKWCNQGLRKSQRGTRAFFYLGDNIITFLFGE